MGKEILMFGDVKIEKKKFNSLRILRMLVGEVGGGVQILRKY